MLRQPTIRRSHFTRVASLFHRLRSAGDSRLETGRIDKGPSRKLHQPRNEVKLALDPTAGKVYQDFYCGDLMLNAVAGQGRA